MGENVPEHEQRITHAYLVHYPAHAPRAQDPHHVDFEKWKRQREEDGTHYCDFAHDHRGGDTSECDNEHPLEAHHKVVELAMLNEVDFALLEQDFPGISDPGTAGTWIDSDKNLTLLCSYHHRGPMGVHVASSSDFTSEGYVRNLIKGA